MQANEVWEGGLAYDRSNGWLVQHEGHVLGSYVQSSYTNLMDLRSGEQWEALSPTRPQRQCIVELTYADRIERLITANGTGPWHGSLGQGRVDHGRTMVERRGRRGPYFYDARDDHWQDQRPLGVGWPQTKHAQIAYASGSDAVVALEIGVMGIYSIHRNRVQGVRLPDVLLNRLGAGIGVDPIERRVVIFGGTGPQGWTWTDDRTQGYADFVRNDTWIYDMVEETWTELITDVRPPRGAPMADHIQASMIYYPPTRELLMMVTPVDEAPPTSYADYPDAELWALSVSEGRWRRIDVENPVRFPGLMAYADHENMIVLYGGGGDGARSRPSQSRQIYTLRLDAAAPAVSSAPEITPLGDGRIRATWASGLILQRADAESFVPGAYETVEGASSPHEDDVSEGARAYRLFAPATGVASAPTFSTPRRTDPPVLEVTSDGVHLHLPELAEDVIGYHVYRAEAHRDGALTESPATGVFVDSAESDGLIRGYVIEAVDINGSQSGSSPVVYTAPDAPSAVRPTLRGGAIRVEWRWPEEARGATVVVYHHDRHTNATSGPSIRAYFDEWREIGSAPALEGSITVDIPADSLDSEHQYIYLRARFGDGPLGFFTDIVSPTDERFRAALP